MASENKRISNFEGLVTLTLDQVILHSIVHHSSTSTYMPNVTEIKETFCGRTDIRVCTYRHLRPTQKSRPNNKHKKLKLGLVASYDL